MKKISTIIISSITTFIVCMISFFLFFNFYMKNLKVELTRTETVENVTITDTGLSQSVEKVYAAVGVIENYVQNKLYATGSGFVFKTDDNYGYVLTNYHVIEDATELYMVMTNEEKVKMEVVGYDEYADIAVLSIPKDKVIKVATIADNSNTKVGDTAFTVGAPLDSEVYYQTVTRGIVSGLNRLVEVSSQSGVVMNVIQTDAAINNGNSGGPLCNVNGEVIGINSLKLASSSIEGMGFAIPIETAMEYAEKFINGDSIVRPYLGISMYNLTSSSNTKGVYVYSVDKNGSLANSGIKKGDIITKINGTTVSSSSYLKYELYKYNVGDTIEITYERDNTEHTVKVKLISNSDA